MMGHGSVGYSGAIFLLICWLCSIAVGQSSLMVHIRNGTLEGSVMTSRKGREFDAFRGIPFAQKPIGELRFEPPKPFGSWTGVRSAKEDANFCIQRQGDGFIGNEDCLYLNVYRPKLASGCQKKYPVMVFIHGGGFYEGSADSGFYGPEYLLDQDVVLVTTNYRLGALGFLSTEDLVAPGNQGLKDQAQAIRWVHENIAAFNGDPNSVTIFGESSGAGSVHLHMISPKVRGLFHRAIMESGDVLAPGALNRPGIGKNQSTTVGQLLGCPTDKSSALLSCLKTKKAVDIFGISCPEQLFPNCSVVAFRPVIEPDHPGAYITGEPAKAVMSGKVANVPWMTGINAQEGAVVAAGIYGPKDQHNDRILDENFLKYAPITMGYDETRPEELKNNITKRIRKFYLGDKKIDESTRWNVIDMYTDTWFYIGSQTSVRVHLQTLTAPVYYYYFAYRGTSSFSELFGDPSRNYGAAHADELQYLFPVRKLLFPNATVSEEDHKMIDVMTTLWVNFARSGDPTPKRTPLIPTKWTPVRSPSLQYLHIENSRSVRMGNNLLSDRVNFWASIPYCKLNEGTNCDYPVGGIALEKTT